MVAVHPLQVKEPSATSSASSVGVDILVEPSSKTSSGASNESNTFWYFAIGSMMSPKSMENRNIVPLTSAPAELFDYELKFFGGMGFGEAVHKPGASFHGVLVSYRTYILHCYLYVYSPWFMHLIYSLTISVIFFTLYSCTRSCLLGLSFSTLWILKQWKD